MAKRTPQTIEAAAPVPARGQLESQDLSKGQVAAPVRARGQVGELEPVRARAQVDSAGELLAQAPAPIRSYIQAMIGSASLAVMDEESLWKLSEVGERMEMAGRLLTGLANLKLSETVEPQRLSEELRRRGKSRTVFYENADVYKAYAALPAEANVRTLAALGYTKSRQLLSWAPEERLALTSGEPVRGLTIDEATDLSSREFVEKIRQNSEVGRLQQALATERSLRESAEAKLKTAQNESALTGLTKRDRHRRATKLTAHGLSELSQRITAELAKVVVGLDDDVASSRDEQLLDRALSTSVWLEVTAAKAALDDLYVQAQAVLAGRISTDDADLPVFTPAEIAEARKRRAAMADMSTKEAGRLAALTYTNDELDGEVDRGAPPAAVKKLRRKGA